MLPTSIRPRRNGWPRGQRWRVVVGHEGGPIYAGTFDSLDEADAAARAKRNELFTANYADRLSALASRPRLSVE